MFGITRRSGFQMTFDNGWTVSVQFGYGNYCENRSTGTALPEGDVKCQTAEVAAWDKDRNWHNFGCDEVEGWQTTNDVLAFMNMIAAK